MAEPDMREFWDARAREDAFYFVDNRLEYQAPDTERFWAEGKANLDQWLSEMGLSVEPTDVMLDIGCGVGRMTRALADQAGKVVGLDVSEEMLRQARELNRDLDNVTWLLGDGASLLGIDDSSIDGCVSVVVLQHIPDPAISLAYVEEIGRVLKPGGWAAIQFSNQPSIHRRRGTVAMERLRSLVRRGPKGQLHPAWLGSALELSAVRRTVTAAGMTVEGTWGEGTLFCRMRLRRGG